MKKFLFSTFQVLAMQGFSQTTKLVGKILVTRILSVHAFGILSLVILWTNLLVPLFSLGTKKLVTKVVSAEIHDGNYRKALGVTIWSATVILAIGIFITLIVTLLTDQVSAAINLSNWYLNIILGLTFLSVALHWQFSLLNGLSKPVVGRIPEFVVLPALLILFLLYCYYFAPNESLDLIVIGYVVIYGISATVGLAMVYKFFSKKIRFSNPDFSPGKSWLKFSVSNLIFNTSSAYLLKLDFLIVGLMATTEMTGLYAIVSNMFATLAFVNLAFNLVMEPKISVFYKTGKLHRLLPFLRSNIYIQLLATMCLYGIVYFFGFEILMLFGEAYTKMHDVLKIICLVLMVQAITGPAPTLLVMTGKVKELIKSNAFSIIIAASLYPIFIGKFGLLGAAYIFVFSITMARVGHVYFVYKTLKINLPQLLLGRNNKVS